MRARVVVRVAVVAALLCGVAADAAGAGGGAGVPPVVLGFQSEGSPPALIDASAPALSLVGVDGLDLAGVGVVPPPDRAAAAQLGRARADGLPAVLLVGNWSNRIDDFSEPLAYRTLRDPRADETATASIAHYVTAAGWDGVSVDLESLLPRDTSGLSRFVADLRAALPAADSLTVCVSAFTTLSAYAANGYDLKALAASADQVVLMTYDDHGPWESTPGPIGPIAWQAASLHAAERVIPQRQLFLGVADYGYAWRPHGNENIDVAQARRIVEHRHARPRWVAAAGEWTARLRDGTTVWWSDARSIRLRLALARRLGVYGVAIWSLGTGDPIPRAR